MCSRFQKIRFKFENSLSLVLISGSHEVEVALWYKKMGVERRKTKEYQDPMRSIVDLDCNYDSRRSAIRCFQLCAKADVNVVIRDQVTSGMHMCLSLHGVLFISVVQVF